MSAIPWFKIDDGFHGHPKVVELSLAAVGLWTLSGSWCAKYLTDGFVQDSTVRRLGGSPDEATELVAANLWLPEVGGYSFRDWADYQPLKSDVEAERAAAQERMRKVRAQKKGVRANSDRTEPERSGEQSPNFGRSSEDVRVTPSQSQSHPSPTTSTEEKTRASRLPKDWNPSETNLAFAAENGLDVAHEVGQFMAHASANGRTQKNWDQAFRVWLGNAKKWARPEKPTPGERAAQTASLGRPLLATELIGIEE